MIATEQLEAVATAARANADIATIRAQFPDLHFTVCSEDDVSPNYNPAVDAGDWQLYYITGASGHCLALTNHAEMATGILLAEKVDES